MAWLRNLFPSSNERPSLTEGSLTRSIFALAIPGVGAMIFQTSFSLIDLYWVGKLGKDAIAAVSISAFVIWMLISLSQLVTVGVTAIIARREGEKDHKGSAYAAWQGLNLNLYSSLAFMALFLMIEPALFQFMKAPDEVASLGFSYLTPIILGLPLLNGFFVLSAIYKGYGNAHTPMIILGAALVVNAILDPCLIFGWGPFPELGIQGAAIATLSARGMGLFIGFIIVPRYMFRTKGLKLRDKWMPDLTFQLQLITIGMPIALGGVLFCFVYIVLTRITSEFGVAAMAALGVGHKLEAITYLICVGFEEAAATLVGQNLGAGKPGRAEGSAWRCLGYTAATVGFLSFFYIFLGEHMVGLFTQDAGVIETGKHYLRIVGFSHIFMASEIVLQGAFSGSGNTVPPSVISIPLTLLRIPAAYFLSYYVFESVDGVWWAISLTTILKGILMAIWFRKNRWKKQRV